MWLWLICYILHQIRSIRGHYKFFVFISKIFLLNSTNYFENFMMSVLHCRIRVEMVFRVSKVLPKMRRCEIADIIGWEWFTNTRTTHREIDNKSRSCFQAFTKDREDSNDLKWVTHELNFLLLVMMMEGWKRPCEMSPVRYKRKRFSRRIIFGDEKWIPFKDPKRKKSWPDKVGPFTWS